MKTKTRYALIHLAQPEQTRDGYGRPKRDGRALTRTSTLSAAVTDMGNIPTWKGGCIVAGIRREPDLLNRSDLTDAKIGALAAVAGGSEDGSAAGTEIHTIVEAILTRRELDLDPNISPEGASDALAVLAAIDEAGFDVVLSETFCVNREADCAGTADAILRDRETGEAFVVDIKSSARDLDGSLRYHGDHGWAVQIAAYANSRPVNEDDNEVDWADIVGVDPSIEWGVVVHVQRGKAKAEVAYVDLVAGKTQIDLALAVRRGRAFRYARRTHPHR